jgi:hypothetical protein
VPFQVLLQQPSGMDAQKVTANGLWELFLSDVCPMWLQWNSEWSHLKTYHLLGLWKQHRGGCLLYMFEEVRLAICLRIASVRGPFVLWQNPETCAKMIKIHQYCQGLSWKIIMLQWD